jgi:hypothetical protein
MPDFATQIAALATLQAPGDLEAVVAEARRYAPEDFTHAIGSTVMSVEGPRLASVYLVSDNYLCELRFDQQGQHFDFVSRKSVVRMEFLFGELQLQGTNGLQTYKSATIRLSHEPVGVVSQFYFVGAEPEPWLETFRGLFPVSELLRWPSR